MTLQFACFFCTDAVYDVTNGYKHCCPTFLDNLFGVDPFEVHINLRCIPIVDISNIWRGGWCLVDDYISVQGHAAFWFLFSRRSPCEGTEAELSTVKCLVNVSATTYFMLLSSIWFKIYVSLVCADLASTIYFDVPSMPVLNFVQAVFNHQLQVLTAIYQCVLGNFTRFSVSLNCFYLYFII